MTRVDHFLLEARYNRWMNRHLMAVCDPLPDAERRRDRGAFFRSIHGTFNHLLLVDHLWLARLDGRAYPISGLDQELHREWEALKDDRAATDEHLVAWLGTLEEGELQTTVGYASAIDREERAFSLHVVLTHLFQHQVHHRGQITTLLSQMGIDFGETDLVSMPGAERAY